MKRTLIQFSICTVLFALLLAVAASAQKAGYKDVPITDAGVGLATDFAVKEQAKRAMVEIKLGKILRAEDYEPKLGERNFRLCLDVTTAGSPLVAQAVVTMDQYSNLRLMGWSKSTCGKSAPSPTAGMGAAAMASDFRPAKTNDPGVMLAADMGVANQAKKTKSKITLNRLVNAEDREPTLGTRDVRLCLDVTTDGKASGVLALISMDQYSNYKLMSWTTSDCAGGGHDGPIEGGYGTADTKQADVAEAAKFAVKAQSAKTKMKFKLGEIGKAEIQVVAGLNYRLCMKVNAAGDEYFWVQSVVYKNLKGKMSLTGWADSTCGEAGDKGYASVETSNAGAEMAADFAVTQHSKDTKVEHKLIRIVKAEVKGKFDPTYRLCMMVSEKDESHGILAIVHMDQYSNMKLVKWEHSNCGGDVH